MTRTMFVTVLVLLLAASTVLQRPPAAGAARGKRVIISTDLAIGLSGGWRGGISDIDDGLAVGMALADPGLDVRGIVAIFGNNNVEPEMVVAQRFVRELLKSSVPILRGAAVKLTNPQVVWSLDGVPLRSSCVNDGVRFMARELRRGPLTIIGLGPLTDVACLAQNFSTEAARITELVAIMGRSPNQSFALGGVAGLTDFNYVGDDRAVQVILRESTIPVTFLTFTLTSSAFVPATALDPFRQRSSALARFIVRSADPWIAQWNGIFHENGFHPWDQNAVYYATHPAAFAMVRVRPQMVSCALGPSDPYNRNPQCAAHGPTQTAGLDREASQLWLGSDGTLRPVQASFAYASDRAKQEFLSTLFGFLR